MRYFKQLNYWYRKYLPKTIQDFFISIKKRYNLTKIFISYFNFFFNLKKKARNSDLSWMASVDDDLSTQNNELIQKLINWASTALDLKLNTDTNLPSNMFLNLYPGEHYKLLAAIAYDESPQNIVEVGTFTGMSARVLLDYSSISSKITTFDLNPWDSYPTYLTNNDFKNKRITQFLEDLSFEEVFNKHKEFFLEADLIFLDAPKDGKFEKNLLIKFSELNFPIKKRYLILDDIRYKEMFEIWRLIKSPKIDATSFGHWSGTGIVDISKGIKL